MWMPAAGSAPHVASQQPVTGQRHAPLCSAGLLIDDAGVPQQSECATLQVLVAPQSLHPEAKTRVVHFVNNPETLAHSTMQSAREDGLQAENDALKEQLRLLEQRAAASGDGSTPDAAGSEAAAVAAAQITILTGKVSGKQRCCTVVHLEA